MHISTLIPVLLAPLSLCAHLRLTIPSTNILPNPSVLPPSTTASLNTLSHHLTAPLRVDNTFDFRNVSTGSYLLDIHCHTHAFLPLRVDVHDGGLEAASKVEVWTTFRGNEWGNKGESVVVREVEKEGVKGMGSQVWGFDVRVQAGKEYFLVRSGCGCSFKTGLWTSFANRCYNLVDPLSILKNPMILIAIVTMGIVFGMPYLMDNSGPPSLILSLLLLTQNTLVDPELKAEFEERQKASPLSGGQAANPLQNFDAAAWLAGSSGKKNADAGTKKIDGKR
jgi:hypothetical protein